MARRRFNLDKTEFDQFTTLIHGGYASGKTHFAADMLKTEAEHGPILFVNVKGEDGSLSAAKLGLGEAGETVENFADFEAMVNEYSVKSHRFRAAVVDSLKPLSKFVMAAVIGTDTRQPSVGGQKNEWGDYHFKMDYLATLLRKLADRVIATCPSDKSVNQLDGRTYITPDLPGRGAAGSAGWFDFVGYIQSDVVGPGKVTRKMIIAPNNQLITRQRLPRPILVDITIPEGGGGWKNFLTEIQKSLA